MAEVSILHLCVDGNDSVRPADAGGGRRVAIVYRPLGGSPETFLYAAEEGQMASGDRLAVARYVARQINIASHLVPSLADFFATCRGAYIPEDGEERQRRLADLGERLFEGAWRGWLWSVARGEVVLPGETPSVLRPRALEGIGLHSMYPLDVTRGVTVAGRPEHRAQARKLFRAANVSYRAGQGEEGLVLVSVEEMFRLRAEDAGGLLDLGYRVQEIDMLRGEGGQALGSPDELRARLDTLRRDAGRRRRFVPVGAQYSTPIHAPPGRLCLAGRPLGILSHLLGGLAEGAIPVGDALDRLLLVERDYFGTLEDLDELGVVRLVARGREPSSAWDVVVGRHAACSHVALGPVGAKLLAGLARGREQAAETRPAARAALPAPLARRRRAALPAAHAA
jgi:hypothetical protein